VKLADRDKIKGPASAATDPDRGSKRLTGHLNMDTNSTAASARQDEHPAVKVRRLMRELSAALAEDIDGRATVALVYPEGQHDYPLCVCYDRDYALMTKRMFAYRDAHREKVRLYHETFRPGEVVPLPEKAQHKAYWDAFHKASQAHMALMDAFDASGIVIDGAAA
jgi:hypothetical protein